MSYTLHRSEHPLIARMTVGEYLDFEERANERHMYLDGEVVAMAGATFEHSVIVADVLRHVGNAIDGGPCQALESNMRIKCGARARYGYSDAAIVCGEPVFEPHKDKRLTLLNPTLVVEVLSDSTRDFDRTEKFEYYRDIPSLQQYVLIEQRAPRVDVFTRSPDREWAFAPYASLDDTVVLGSIGAAVAMRHIYGRIRFSPPPLELVN